jgi:hypothetical protein
MVAIKGVQHTHLAQEPCIVPGALTFDVWRQQRQQFQGHVLSAGPGDGSERALELLCMLKHSDERFDAD